MVWDAAAKTQNISLNSQLVSGPDLLSPLVDVLRRFRQYRYAITADIREMFHQVLIQEADRDSQRFLYQESDDTPPKTYRMNVMTFGATCSPFAAHFVKNFNASKFALKYPEAVSEITENHYVDDYASSYKSEEEAVRVTKEVIMIHDYGGFELRGFAANSSKVLEALGQQEIVEIKALEAPDELGTKVLGLFWRTTDDTLNFRTDVERIGSHFFEEEYHPTKREILKVMMMVFDPLGLITPFLVQIKILMQDVWRSGIDWDTKVEEKQKLQFHQWLAKLRTLQVSIPRCYCVELSDPEEQDVELHVFVDASQLAFAAVAYFRVKTTSGARVSSLIGAKSKVAPLKPLSIPRLELQAAVLGTRLASSIRSSHTVRIRRQTFWSDSMNVLGWVRSVKKRYKTFVALRIGEILENSKADEWRYVPTAINIADDATKPKPDTFHQNSRWFKGPEFLELDETDWPIFPQKVTEPSEEARSVQVNVETTKPNATPDFKNISKWESLLRAQVWVLRVLKCGRKFQRSIFTKEELEEAEKEVWRTVQAEQFHHEIGLLKAGEQIPPTSDIYTLSPFIGEDRLLRMRGRLKYAKISENAKHPIIVPKHHRATRLLIERYHRKFLHANNETIVNELRQQYWIPRMRVIVRTVCRNCLHCGRQRANPTPPLMADLPTDRVTPCTPFTFVGLDYFGPLVVANLRRREKRWVAVFTCLSIRAVHLEIVHNLSSDSTIQAIRRFVSTRGVPRRLWSDNATSFKGAKNEIDELQLSEVAKELDGQIDKFDWVFIPPAAPHMGGSWERMVQSVKKALAQIQPMKTPTEEQLSTYLAEVANIVNSRPLTYMPVEDGTIEAITPNHFLLQSSRGAKTLGEIPNDGRALRRMWRQTQLLLDEFWKRWTHEFIPTLNKRSKWHSETKPLQVGDVGMLWDDSSRSSWRMGRIEEVKQAADGHVREVVVRTASGLYRRPAVRFAALEVRDASTESESSPGSFTEGGIVTVAADSSAVRTTNDESDILNTAFLENTRN